MCFCLFGSGEHVDYSGYGVLPMAIAQDIVVAVAIAKTPGTQCTIANTNPKHAKFSFDGANIVIDTKKHHWGNYAMAGYKGITEALGLTSPRSLYLMVDGVIPAGAGLSSSSALVCCIALAVARGHDKVLTKLEFAEICTKCERYIGTEGGGMDQSISFMANQGAAMNIEFGPLRAFPVKLPDGAAFVVADSSVVSEKQVTAATNFNLRVVECRLSALLLAKLGGVQNWQEARTILRAQNALNASFDAMLALVSKHFHPHDYSLTELSGLFGLPESEIVSSFMSASTVEARSFRLFQRVSHVLQEASRTAQFKTVCDTAPDATTALAKLGQLMNDSHTSCRDLYECSCEELDDLTSICRQQGALGSRLTGAGWGGCCVSLVPSDKVDAFVANVKRLYFERKGIANGLIFASPPGCGAAIVASDAVSK
ncbi:galactokinase, variant 4 [Capsaspora owczarzaki ATCC 30864]|uniref:Galactokinase, variant 1 n=1 Tax=Capsaspora owczarzaki (strain ATCC 30864) TaxID=595528 RepID=A0A0D2WVZ3_CAPO3|nr:galactokinase, variant 1 [Capsaspora owczarzaki ATCC 30864]KJE97066.1 galactokinase, variant 2 [Capsaspora owczarzaki ATCC 30864]KJE97067.1 galactokinase, variant 3 [Capsaspora owczarzaki ATCC 30864]KJE97068.1 galactokinase, variant 4 [Capsaspora owczarzaki ATCC 30864]